MSNQGFTTGDRVHHKSLKLDMIVIGFTTQEGETTAECRWMAESGDVKIQSFLPAELINVEPPVSGLTWGKR